MIKVLDICKDNCENLYPYSLKLICSGNGTYISITQNDVEIERTPFFLNKLVETYETSRRIIHPMTAIKYKYTKKPMFIAFNPEYTSNHPLAFRNVKLVTVDNINDISNELTLTPEETLSVVLRKKPNNHLSLKTSSYNPKIKIENDLTINDIIVTNNIGKRIPFNFDVNTNTLSFKKPLIGNMNYMIKLNASKIEVNLDSAIDSVIDSAIDSGNVTITETFIHTLNLFVTKKKLRTYDYIELNEDYKKIDIDNDINIKISNVEADIEQDISVFIDDIFYSSRVEFEEIKNDSGEIDAEKNDINIKINFYGLLQENHDYEVNIYNKTELIKTLHFTTNLFHSSVYKEYFSELFLKVLNTTDSNEYVYLVNESDKEIYVYSIIGYSDVNITDCDIC